jgi:hypothetical protein
MSDNVEVRCLGKSAMSSDPEAFNAGVRCQNEVRELEARVGAHGMSDAETKKLKDTFGDLQFSFDTQERDDKPASAKTFDTQLDRFNRFISDSSKFPFLAEPRTVSVKEGKGDRLDAGPQHTNVAKKGDRLDAGPRDNGPREATTPKKGDRVVKKPARKP